MQVRLFEYQVERIKKSGVSGSAIIKYAVRRYHRGDFANCKVVQDTNGDKNGEKVPLVGYPVKSRFDLPDSLLRQILTWHFETPDKERIASLDREIERLDAQIALEMAMIAGKEYILES